MSLSPVTVVLLSGRLSLEKKTLDYEYGSVVCVSSNELAFHSIGVWEGIYAHRSGRANMHMNHIHVGSVEAVQGLQEMEMQLLACGYQAEHLLLYLTGRPLTTLRTSLIATTFCSSNTWTVRTKPIRRRESSQSHLAPEVTLASTCLIWR